MQSEHVYGEIFNFGLLHLEWPTALFILVVFTVTMIAMNTLLFKPLLRTLEAREQLLEGEDVQTQDLKAELEKAHAAFAAIAEKNRAETENAHVSMSAEVNTHLTKLEQEAHARMEEETKSALESIQADRTQALKDAEGLSAQLAQLIKTKALA